MAGDAESLGQARSTIRSLLDRATPEVRDVAVLLTNEIVTNAVVHGGGRFTLTAKLEYDTLRVAVRDASQAGPHVLAPSTQREHGRGMAIVEALATVWGTERGRAGKIVWFELDLRRQR